MNARAPQSTILIRVGWEVIRRRRGWAHGDGQWARAKYPHWAEVEAKDNAGAFSWTEERLSGIRVKDNSWAGERKPKKQHTMPKRRGPRDYKANRTSRITGVGCLCPPDAEEETH